MRFDALRSFGHLLASRPLILGLDPLRHFAPDEGGGDPPATAAPDLGRFFEATHDPLLVYGADLQVAAANEAAARLLRQPVEQLLGRSVLEIPLLVRAIGAASVPQRLRGDVTLVRDEVTLVDAEGQALQCRLEALRLADDRVLLHLQDTTAALRAQAALHVVEDLHRAAGEVVAGVTWTMALPEERVIEVGPAVERLFGHQPAAFLQHPGLWDELVHPGDRERVRSELRTGVAGGRPFEIHFTGVHRDRHDLPFLVNHVVPVRSERSWSDRAFGIIEDRSERHRLEEELADARSHLRNVLDTIATGVLVTRLRRGRPEVAVCNRRLAEMLRLDEPLRPGTPLAKSPPDLRRLLEGADTATGFGRRLLSEEAEEYVAELKNPLRVLRTYAGPLRDAHGAVVGRILAAEDITTSWVMQRRLAHAQKMESMGRLAGGVAHDFNNVLGTILGFGALLLEQTGADDPRHEPAAQIVSAAERAARLTQALLAFSRSARFERVPLQLNRVVEDAYQLLRSALDPSIALTLRLAPELPPLLGDALLLQQALVDLTQELRESLGSRGTLTISTRVAEPPRPAGEPRTESEAHLAILLELEAVRGGPQDAAVGPAADRAGLTLTIVEDIVRTHGGWLVVEPVTGGSVVRVVLPVDVPDEAPVLVPTAATAHGHETVLVVDDEPGLRTLARTGLQHHGFDVVAVETGEEALEVLQKGVPRVDVMLLDLTLPGMSGESVLRALRRVAPGLPVIIASGYANVESQAAWTAAGAVGFVAKPYRIQQVAQRLREALDRPQSQVS